jgi:ABC-type sugar transport system substrate-binding protein
MRWRALPRPRRGKRKENAEMPRRCVIVLAGAMLAGLWTGCGETATPPSPPRKAKTKTAICLLPRQKGLPYFTRAAQGALDAVEGEQGISLIYDGPTDGSPAKAAALIETWTRQEVNVIAVASDDSKAVADAMSSARHKGLHVIAWETDVPAGDRELFVSPAAPGDIASALIDTLVKDLGGDPNGDVAIITTTEQSESRNAWIAEIKASLSRHTRLNLVDVKPCNDNEGISSQAVRALITPNGSLRAIIALSPSALAGAAEAVRNTNLRGITVLNPATPADVTDTVRNAKKTGQVLVTGICGPRDARRHILDGTVKSVVYWNPEDMGYLTAKVAVAVAKGAPGSGAKTIDAGRLGTRTITGDTVLLGQAQVFNKDNISKADF